MLIRVLLLLLFIMANPAARATEEPEYKLVHSVGDVELRRYDPAIAAVTVMDEDGGGFRTLAGYIFGGNDGEQSIAMTAPVQRNLDGDVREMVFFMPAAYDMQSLPAPDSPDVELREVPARTVAVLRFSGRATRSAVQERRQQLAETLQAQSIAWRGEWLLNQYNPPWTPSFLRRNEIWVEVEWPRAQAPAAAVEEG